MDVVVSLPRSEGWYYLSVYLISTYFSFLFGIFHIDYFIKCIFFLKILKNVTNAKFITYVNPKNKFKKYEKFCANHDVTLHEMRGESLFPG